MIYQILSLPAISPAQLDDYLAQGWYRNGQKIFTTDFVPHADGLSPVVWLRFDLARLQFGKKQRALLSKNARFSATVRPLEFTEEMMELYQRYRASIDFDACRTPFEYLVEGGATTHPVEIVYQSKMFEVRDGAKLIAIGVFDHGHTSLAGVLNYFDPEYRSFSLGKWLMLKKILLAQEWRMPWYYPGYISHGFSKFDYKTFPDALSAEIYDISRKVWLPYTPETLAALAGEISLDHSLEALLRLFG